MSDRLLTMHLIAVPTQDAVQLCDYQGGVEASVRWLDTAVRLAACFNACQGLPTESLKRLGTLDRARVSQDVTRDHMRAALQQALPIIDAYRRLSGGDGDIVAANIRAMLR